MGAVETRTGAKLQLAVFVSHPIQYQAPLYREITAQGALQLRVYFWTRDGFASYLDREFGREVRWDVPVLDGYESEFLSAYTSQEKPLRDKILGVMRAVQVLRRDRPDAVLLYGWAGIENWLLLLAARVLGVAVILRSEANLMLERGGWLGRIRRLVLRGMFSQVAAMACIGTLNAEFYRSYGVPPERLFLAPYSVDNGYFSERSAAVRAERAERLKKYGVRGSGTVFGFAGKLIEKKRAGDVIEAFGKVREKREACLLIAGDGEMGPALQKLCRDRGIEDVVFMGFQNQSEMRDFYGLLDVLVVPSSIEPWGLVVNEAMASGVVPLVSDRVGCWPDLLGVPGADLVFAPCAVSEMVERMLVLADGDTLRQMRLECETVIGRWGLRETGAGIRDAVTAAVRQ